MRQRPARLRLPRSFRRRRVAAVDMHLELEVRAYAAAKRRKPSAESLAERPGRPGPARSGPRTRSHGGAPCRLVHVAAPSPRPADASQKALEAKAQSRGCRVCAPARSAGLHHRLQCLLDQGGCGASAEGAHRGQGAVRGCQDPVDHTESQGACLHPSDGEALRTRIFTIAAGQQAAFARAEAGQAQVASRGSSRPASRLPAFFSWSLPRGVASRLHCAPLMRSPLSPVVIWAHPCAAWSTTGGRALVPE